MGMRTIGLIGGITWEASSDYYRTINREVSRRLGGAHSGRIAMVSLDFQELVDRTTAGDEAGALAVYVDAAQRLQRAGAECLVLCANTAHRFATELGNAVDLPLLHIGDAVGQAIQQSDCTVVGLVGTRRTMEGRFLTDKLEQRYGLAVRIPSQQLRHEIDRCIFQEMAAGVFSEAARTVVDRAVQELADDGAQGIVLGCTELPILMRGRDLRIQCFDSTTLHATAAVDYALSATLPEATHT